MENKVFHHKIFETNEKQYSNSNQRYLRNQRAIFSFADNAEENVSLNASNV